MQCDVNASNTTHAMQAFGAQRKNGSHRIKLPIHYTEWLWFLLLEMTMQ